MSVYIFFLFYIGEVFIPLFIYLLKVYIWLKILFLRTGKKNLAWKFLKMVDFVQFYSILKNQYEFLSIFLKNSVFSPKKFKIWYIYIYLIFLRKTEFWVFFLIWYIYTIFFQKLWYLWWILHCPPNVFENSEKDKKTFEYFENSGISKF